MLKRLVNALFFSIKKMVVVFKLGCLFYLIIDSIYNLPQSQDSGQCSTMLQDKVSSQ